MLNDKILKKIKPEEKPFPFPIIPNLYLLINPDGNKFFRFRGRFNGQDILRSLGEFPTKTNLQKAIKKRDEYYEKFSNGVDPAIERKKKSTNENIPTAEAFLEEYFKHKILKKSTETESP